MEKRDLEIAVKSLEKVICISFSNNWNVHSAIGGKYGELFAACELWKWDPQIGNLRKEIRGLERPTSADIVLLGTRKKIEVKWGMLHHKPDDFYFKSRGGVPYWGWGFSSGKQFKDGKDGKFDYCVLLAARKNLASPKHVCP